MSIFYFVISLIFLYISKRWLTSVLASVIHRIGGNRHTLIVVWSLIFLPGTIIHELSHFLFAILTGARTGKIEIFPEYLEEDWEEENRGQVALGYVQTQKLNPIQGFFVGVAPFLVGITLLIWLGNEIQKSYIGENYLYLFLESYLFFTLGNSFFPSWSDIKQTLSLIIVTLLLLILVWVVGMPLIIVVPDWIYSLAETMSLVLILSAFINVLFSGIFSILMFFSKKSYR